MTQHAPLRLTSNTSKRGGRTFAVFGSLSAMALLAVAGLIALTPSKVSAAQFAPNQDTGTAAVAAEPSQQGPYYGSGVGPAKYFSPGDGRLDGYEPWNPNAVNPPASIVSPRGEWAAGATRCGLYHAGDAQDIVDSQPLTVLSGLGIGHLGVTGYLEHGYSPEQYTSVILFDPGNFNTNACEDRVKYNAGISQAKTYANWLKLSKENRLVVFAGRDTRDAAHPKVVNGKKQYNQGLRREVFAKLTTSQKQQVIVCEYADMGNSTLAQTFLPWMNKAAIKNPTQCPQNPDRKGAKVNAWRP